MAFTQAQLTDLEEAIASPEKIVKFNGREITKKEAAEMMQAYLLMKSELDVTPKADRTTYSIADFS